MRRLLAAGAFLVFFSFGPKRPFVLVLSHPRLERRRVEFDIPPLPTPCPRLNTHASAKERDRPACQATIAHQTVHTSLPPPPLAHPFVKLQGGRWEIQTDAALLSILVLRCLLLLSAFYLGVVVLRCRFALRSPSRETAVWLCVPTEITESLEQSCPSSISPGPEVRPTDIVSCSHIRTSISCCTFLPAMPRSSVVNDGKRVSCPEGTMCV